MDANTSRYLEAELSQKDAALRAMKEQKARKAEAARIAAVQHPGVGYSERYGVGNGGIPAVLPSQMPLGLLPGVSPQQEMNAMMLPGSLPVNVPRQGTPFVTQHYTRELNGNPINANYHGGQGAPGYYTPPMYLASHVQHQQLLPSQVVDAVELDEEVEIDEQSSPTANASNGQYRSQVLLLEKPKRLGRK
jgi:hypothetical protein